MRNFFVYTLLRSFLYYVFYVPFRYIALPVIRYSLNHKLQLILTVAFTLLSLYFPVFSIGLVIPALSSVALMLVNAITTGVIIGFLADRLVWFGMDISQGQRHSEINKFVSWAQQQTTFTKGLLTLGAISMIAGLVIILFFPAMLPLPQITTLFILAAIPMAIYVLQKISVGIKILLGIHVTRLPACHNPKLPRNKSLDMYSLTQQETFHHETLKTYDAAKQSLSTDKKTHKNTHGAKRPEQEHTTLEVTKAKLHDIQRTVSLTRRFSLFQAKDKLQQQENLYQMGLMNP